MNFRALLKRNFDELYSQQITVLATLLAPVALIFFFGSIYHTIPYVMFTSQSLTPGIVIFGHSLLVMFSAYQISNDRQKEFLISLTEQALYKSLTAYVLPYMLLGLMQLSIVLAVGTLMGGMFQQVPETSLFYFFFALLCTMTGLLIGLHFTPVQVISVGVAVILADALFCGAWLDVNMLGNLFKNFSYYLPFANAVDISRAMLKGISFFSNIHAFFELLLYLVVVTSWLIIAYANAIGKKSK